MIENHKKKFVLEVIPKLKFQKKIDSAKDFCEKTDWDAPSLSQMKQPDGRDIPDEKFNNMLKYFNLQQEF